MSENLLQTHSVSYAEFLQGMAENADSGSTVLDSMAALSLVRHGAASRFPSIVFSYGTMLFVAAAVVLPFFFSWPTIVASLFLAFISHRIAKIFIMRSAWKALLGGQPADMMEQVYIRLVSHDMLHASRWNKIRPDLDAIYRQLYYHRESLYKREEERDVDESKVSIQESFFGDGKTTFGHADVIDYSKHDMDIESQREKTLQEFNVLAENFSLKGYPELYKEIVETLETLDYNKYRYRHGEFNPPDMIATSTASDIVEKNLPPKVIERFQTEWMIERRLQR